MKKYIIAAAFTACLALCAAVWPQNEAVEGTPVPTQVAAVGTPKPIVEDIAVEKETLPPAEEEKIEILQLQSEPLNEAISELELIPKEVPTVPKAQPTPEPEQEAEPVSAPESTSAPVSPQTITDPQAGDIVYVPGFGWLECQDPGEIIYAEDIYENGNKVGVMG